MQLYESRVVPDDILITDEIDHDDGLHEATRLGPYKRYQQTLLLVINYGLAQKRTVCCLAICKRCIEACQLSLD